MPFTIHIHAAKALNESRLAILLALWLDRRLVVLLLLDTANAADADVDLDTGSLDSGRLNAREGRGFVIVLRGLGASICSTSYKLESRSFMVCLGARVVEALLCLATLSSSSGMKNAGMSFPLSSQNRLLRSLFLFRLGLGGQTGGELLVRNGVAKLSGPNLSIIASL